MASQITSTSRKTFDHQHRDEELKGSQDDQVILQALLDSEPEFSWEDIEAAPVPSTATPSPFFVHTRLANEPGLFHGNAGAPLSRNAKRKAERLVQSDSLWKKNTFPFGYFAPRPPELLPTLLHLKDGDPIPQSSIISSPYYRIPPYTYCVRTSTNWRHNKDLRSRCRITFVPFFPEDNYEDEDEYRDRMNESKGKVAFHIPNEDEDDDLATPPSTHICAICLSVGCVIHRESLGQYQADKKNDVLLLSDKAPAVPQPKVEKEDDVYQQAALATASGSRFYRRQARERNTQGCGPDCILKMSEEDEQVSRDSPRAECH